jgi:type IV pilus assembly protein PilC
MAYFICRLATEEGRPFSQTLFAPSVEECRKYFEEEGLCILSIKRDWKKFNIHFLPFEKKIKDKDFIMFNQELMALVKAGYPILKSIETIAGRIKNLAFKELLMKVEAEIRGGKSLSEAFIPFEKEFSTVYTASLMAGERSGNLAGTLGRYIDYAKVVSQTKSRIRSALIYPTLLIIFSFILITILINFILPRFSAFYADFQAQLPGITQTLIAFSLAMRKNLPFLLIFFFLLVIVYFQMKKRKKTAILLDRAKLQIPYGRAIWRESGISLFCRTLGLLLEAGISLLSGIGVAQYAVPNRYLVERMKDLPDHIKNGESLSESLAKTGFFPPLSLDMIRIGETSANLEGMLADVADFYDGRVRGRIDTFVSLIEPVIIIFMGLIAAAMLLSVYLPIFNIIRVTQ